MDDGLMVNYPRDGMGNLLCDLFSLRQMQQISVSSPFADVPAYYCNLDADLASRAVMRRKNVGAQTLQAHLNARYLEMLSSSPRYWVASALEDLEAGEKPADFYAVACGVGELRVRLQGEISGHNLDHLSSKKMQDSFSVWFQCAERPVKDVIPAAQLDRQIEDFGAHYQTILRRDPSPLYTHLRRVRERKVMTDPFVDRLAQKILLAAYSFNPNLLFADKERPSFRGADKEYGGCSFG